MWSHCYHKSLFTFAEIHEKMTRPMLLVLSALLVVVCGLPDLRKFRSRPHEYGCLSMCTSQMEFCDVNCKFQFGKGRAQEDKLAFRYCLSDCGDSFLNCIPYC